MKWLPADRGLPPRQRGAQEISKALGREPNDPAVTAAFDRMVMVLRGQLVPFVEDWWELVGWSCGQVERVVAHLQPGP